MWFSNTFEEYDSILNQNIPSINTEDIKYIIEDQKFDTSIYKQEYPDNIPLINISFYSHIFRDNNIPTLNEFIQNYERDNKCFLNLMPEELYEGIKYRLIKSYPSLVRDTHFVNCARELGYDTIHTIQLDLHGIDAIVNHNDKKLLFRLFLDTKKSRKHLKYKTKKHKLNLHINYGLNQNNRIIVGDIFLYDPEHIKITISRFLEEKELNNKEIGENNNE